MKIFINVLVAIFAIVLVSSVSCDGIDPICFREGKTCATDNDCCSELTCQRSYLLYRKVCKPNVSILQLVKSKLSPEADPFFCKYDVLEDNQQERDLLNSRFGVNVGFPLLEAHTVVDVKIGNRTVRAQVNGKVSKQLNVVSLSQNAASELGISSSDTQKCSVHVPFWINHSFLRRIMYFIPVGGLLYGAGYVWSLYAFSDV